MIWESIFHPWLLESFKFLSYCGFCSNRILLYIPLFVRWCTGVTSHISHIYKGINAILIIRGPIKPYTFWIKIILAIFLERPDQTRPSSRPWPTWPLILALNYQKYKCWIRNVYFVLLNQAFLGSSLPVVELQIVPKTGFSLLYQKKLVSTSHQPKSFIARLQHCTREG